MLAADLNEVNLETLRYPLLATPKLDGIRCILRDGKVLSRSLKSIPNHHIRSALEFYTKRGEALTIDGELVVGKNFNETTSAVMSYDGVPDFKYVIFDTFTNPLTPYFQRDIQGYTFGVNLRAEEKICTNAECISIFEQQFLEQGYEGIILRDPKGIYKFGRSTINEQYLLKLKRFTEGEAYIIGFEEMMHNANPEMIDRLGYAEHSSEQEGMIPAGMLGALLVRDIKTGIEFKIGSGFTEQQRIDIWNRRTFYLAPVIVKYKHQQYGMKDKPRAPIFLGFRDPKDL